MAHDIFISYSHKDKAIADAICANLENAGARCWIAPRDIAPGQDWPTAISDAIASSRIMVLVFSANSNSSDDVGRELILAANNKLIIIPFKIENIPPEPGKQYYLARTHWLDAMNPPTQEEIDKLVGFVKSFMSGEKAASGSPAGRGGGLPSSRQAQARGRFQRKYIWLWAIPLLILLGGAGWLVFHSLGLAAPPAPPTETATTPIGASTPRTDTPTETLEPISITIWHQWSGEQLAAAQDVFDAYMTLHPNITIILSNFGTNMTDSLNAAVPSGQGPDIIAGELQLTSNLAENAAAGNIVPLDDYGITQDWLKSTYEPAAANGVIWNGKIWALPESESGYAMIYNRELASASDFPEDPLDFNGLLAEAKSYYEANGKPLFSYSSLYAYSLGPVFFGFGLPTFVDEQGNAYLDTEQALDATIWLVKTKPYTLPLDQGSSSGISAFLEKQAAAVWCGSWVIKNIREAGLDYGVLPMGRSFVSVNAVLLTSNAVDRGHDQAAADILKYYTSVEIQKQITLRIAENTDGVYIPAQTAVLHDPQVTAYPDIVVFAAALHQGVPYPNGLYARVALDHVNKALSIIWTESQAPDSALVEAQAEIEADVAGMR
jgi:arabinogalactan oligomer/maltooligosaccharide transport system substrate-binding protein